MLTSIVMTSDRSETKLHFTQMKEINFIVHEIFQIQPFASTVHHFTLCLLSFSVCQISFYSSTIPKDIPKNTLVTPWLRMRQDKLEKSHKVNIELQFDRYCAYICTWVLKPCQKSFGTETHHFQRFPLPMVQTTTMTRYLAYTLS